MENPNKAIKTGNSTDAIEIINTLSKTNNMSTSKKEKVELPELPYAPLGKLASRDESREFATKRNRETLLFPFEKIKEREDFNTRTVYRGIEELAQSIKATGLHTPLTCDITADGIALVEAGYRRRRALQLLWDEGWLQTADVPGILNGSVEIFRNDSKVTELERIVRILTSNAGEPLTAYEIGSTMERLHTYFGKTPKEISAITGFSRQQVENMLILAKEPAEVHAALDEGIMKPTTAIALARATDNAGVKDYIIRQLRAGKNVLKQSEVKEWVKRGNLAMGVIEDPEPVRTCRVCGCTEEDCRQCIEAQGFPCSWAEKDLCSRCQNEAAVKAFELFEPTLKKLHKKHSSTDETWWRSRWSEFVDHSGGDDEKVWKAKKNLELLWPVVWKKFQYRFKQEEEPVNDGLVEPENAYENYEAQHPEETNDDDIDTTHDEDVVKQTLYVSAELYAQLNDKFDIECITKGKIRKLFNIEGKVYCLSGRQGSSDKIDMVSAYEAVPLPAYRNEKKPLPYMEHFTEVGKGERERSHDGLLLEYKGMKHVLVGPEINIKSEVSKPVTVPYNDKAEMQQANKSTRPPSPPKDSIDNLNNIKLEETFCTETLQMLDQIYTIITKLPKEQAQAAKDIQIKVDACIQRVSSVKEFVKKAEIRTRD